MFLVHFRAVSVAESGARDAVPKSHVTAGVALHLPRCVPEQTSFRGSIARPLCPESLAFLAQVTLTDDLESDRTRLHTVPNFMVKERKRMNSPRSVERRKLNFLAPASSLSYGRKEETRKVSLILFPATHPFPWPTCRLLTRSWVQKPS